MKWALMRDAVASMGGALQSAGGAPEPITVRLLEPSSHLTASDVASFLSLGVAAVALYVSLHTHAASLHHERLDRIEKALYQMQVLLNGVEGTLRAIQSQEQLFVGRGADGRFAIQGVPSPGPFEPYTRPLLPKRHPLRAALVAADEAWSEHMTTSMAFIDSLKERGSRVIAPVPDVRPLLSQGERALDKLTDLSVGIEDQRSRRFLLSWRGL